MLKYVTYSLVYTMGTLHPLMIETHNCYNIIILKAVMLTLSCNIILCRPSQNARFLDTDQDVTFDIIYICRLLATGLLSG